MTSSSHVSNRGPWSWTQLHPLIRNHRSTPCPLEWAESPHARFLPRLSITCFGLSAKHHETYYYFWNEICPYTMLSFTQILHYYSGEWHKQLNDILNNIISPIKIDMLPILCVSFRRVSVWLSLWRKHYRELFYGSKKNLQSGKPSWTLRACYHRPTKLCESESKVKKIIREDLMNEQSLITKRNSVMAVLYNYLH